MFFPVFLSVIILVRNQSDHLNILLQDVTEHISSLVSKYEIIVVDNASDNRSVAVLKNAAGGNGFPNLQVYALTKKVDADTCVWVGMENALGDLVAVLDPLADDIGFLPEMLDKAVSGSEVVFARNGQKAAQTFAYRLAFAASNRIYRMANGVDLSKEAPQYRVLSKRIINFILQHTQPAMTYRYLPATGGFAQTILNYDATPRVKHVKRMTESIDRGMRLLVSTTRAPMRLVKWLSMLGAGANLLYSVPIQTHIWNTA